MAESKTSAEDYQPERKVGRGKNSGTGPFAGTQSGAGNDGVSSAKPEAVTGQEDATFESGDRDTEVGDLAEDK